MESEEKTAMQLSIVKPFSSPAWGSNFSVFSGQTDPISEKELRDYLAKASRFAKAQGLYLVPERFMMAGYHCLCLISPKGEVITAQQALFPSQDSPYRQGKSLVVASTELGKVALAVGDDIDYPEVAKIAAKMGVAYLVSSQFIPNENYNNLSVVSGIWGAAQSNHLFGIGVSNQFHCVTAPRIIKQYQQGFIVAPTKKYPVTAGMKAQVLDYLPPKPSLDAVFYMTHQNELMGREE